jgi:hypothetical protein
MFSSPDCSFDVRFQQTGFPAEIELEGLRINGKFSSSPLSRTKVLHANCIVFGRARAQALPNRNLELNERPYD